MQLIGNQPPAPSGIFTIVNGIELENVGFIIIWIFTGSWLVSVGVHKLKRYDPGTPH